MDKLWFEEELSLADQVIDEVSKKIAESIKGPVQQISRDLIHEAHGIVRAHKPDWAPLTPEESKNVLASGHNLRLFKVRLIFEFEILKENVDRGVRITSACCEANIRPVAGASQPEIYDLFPKDLYEGEPQKVSLKFAPEITVDKIGVSVGEIGADIVVGQVTPVIVGYFGDKKQEPHWDLRPQSKSLLGRQYLWLVISLPEGCDGIRLACRAEADIQTKFGPIAIGPKQMVWDNRPSIIIR